MSPTSDETLEQEKELDLDQDEQEFIRRAGWEALFGFTTKKHLPVLCGSIFFTATAALTLPALAVMYGLIFNQFANYGSGKISGGQLLRNVSKYCTYTTAVAALNWLTNSIYFMLALTFGELQARSARDRIFNALLKKTIEWYDTRKSGIGAFLPALQMQVRDLQLATASPMGEAIQCIVSTVAAIVIAFYFSWNLTLVIICTVPIVYLIMAFLSSQLSKRAHQQADKLQEALKYVTNAIQSIEFVKCFNGEPFELQKYGRVIARAASLYNRQTNLRSIQLGFMQFITLSMFVQGFWYGSYLVITEKRTAGQVVTTFWAALVAVQGLTGFLPQFIVLQKGKVAGARLLAMIAQMQQDGKGPETRSGKILDHFSGEVEFKQVSFSYPALPDSLALRDVKLFFPAGETTFVIGRSGSGKSTLGQLLVRFYEPAAGDICIDGVPLRNIDSHWLRENITLVEQHSVLFNDTIYRNISLAKWKYGSVSCKEVEKAVEFALLQQMINDLPNGFDTVVGLKGTSISGGQRQRIALARARLRDTPVLVLDESTSALDYVMRSTIVEAIRTWRRGKTTIIITHDIAQILPDDFVYVLDKSQVVQEGYRKAMEAEKDSAFHAFVTSRPEKLDEWERSSDDGTDEVMSLYAAAWAATSYGTSRATSIATSRPTSAVIFDEPYLSPFLNTRRESVLQIASPYPRFLREDANRSGPSSRLGHEASIQSVPVFELSSPSPSIHGAEEKESHQQTLSSNVSQVRKSYMPSEIPSPPQKRPPQRRRFSLKEQRQIRHETGEESTTTPMPPSIPQILSTVWPKLDWLSRLLLMAAIFCAIVHAACTPSFSYVFGRLLSTFYVVASQQQLTLIYALAILSISIADGLATYGFHFLFDYCAQVWINETKLEAIHRILNQPRDFFDRDENSVSCLAECLDRFAEEARNLPGRFAGIVLVMVVMMVIAVAWSLVLCWKLTLVALATGPVLYAITYSYNTVSGRWTAHSNDADAAVSKVLHETFVNIRTVRCLVLEEPFRKRYTKATTSALKVGIKRAFYCGSFFGLNYAGVLFVASFLFWFGAYIVSSGEFETTNIIQTFTVLLLSVNYVNFIVIYVPQIGAAKDAGARLIRLSRLPQDSHEHRGTVRLRSVGNIVLQDVNFTYRTRQDHPVLHHINFRIPQGSCTAIVGSSGSGKSTIAALLLKLYQTKSITDKFRLPDITISGHDIRRLHTSTLRSRIAIVSQTPVLFPGTIAENMAYGLSPESPEASLSSIRSAAFAAGIDDFINSLPLGYQTVVGEGGTGLSGGQAQRIAIARALVRQPDILILDEVTSALDVESVGIIRDTIRNLVVDARKLAGVAEEGGSLPVTPMVSRLGRMTSERTSSRVVSRAGIGSDQRSMTVIIITHAREMMAIAEHIVMLDRGKVVEEGTFDELKRKRGPFARLLRGGDGEAPERGEWRDDGWKGKEKTGV
ncbi:P-loop containing nucleoside triphosphate hydrolase protein [Zopfia rhizophila CBS 207.26]|uniref:P-loop containing nucleoside triphosphate hydrolase protein n=1 Tax=Zopfia rhizophila CBS 207.26 TaxID=1314779 RepID=A0A6A6DHH1_9PEZI|nr:P-loop containing nucleoside triphosphate hydrolase protein [Zopfia rhizophila CBS 207.26]